MNRRALPFTVLAALLAVVPVACAETDDDDADAAAAPAGEAPSDMAEDPDIAPAGAPTGLPEGYALRLDRAGDDAAYRVTEQDGSLHVQTGPAGILYDEEDAVADGDYTVSATFTEVGAPPNHREAFGLFIGGSDLQGAEQAYTYFLVRADGRYLIKRRTGSETANVSEGGWVASEAVNGAAEGGDVSNALAIEVQGDQVQFRVNDAEVATIPAAEIDAHGVAGVRINHNLDVRVEDFDVSG